MRRVLPNGVLRIGLGTCLWISATLGAAGASAQEPTCVTLCQQKIDACASQCEAFSAAVYREPESLRQCQLGCAKQLFVACFERCTQTGEVRQDDYGLLAEHPDHLPPAPEG